LSGEVVDLAWPDWWSEEAESSPSARAELRFALARRLGLDAKVLLEEDEPRFAWRAATFKHLSATSKREREAMISYGTSIARTVLAAAPRQGMPNNLTAQSLRERLLAGTRFVALPDLLSYCWAIGIPTMSLKVFPIKSKRMCAMATRVRNRYAILLARESKFPAQLAYYVAHELGHIALGHLSDNPAVIDADDPLRATDRDDPEEIAADRFALELLAGDPDPHVLTDARKFTAASLAKAAIQSAPDLRIEPGTLALCFGYSTGRWNKTVAALRRIYPQDRSVGPYINQVAFSQIPDGALSHEAEQYLRGATGTSR